SRRCSSSQQSPGEAGCARSPRSRTSRRPSSPPSSTSSPQLHSHKMHAVGFHVGRATRSHGRPLPGNRCSCRKGRRGCAPSARVVYCAPVSRRHALLLWAVLGTGLAIPSPALASPTPAGSKSDPEPSAVSHETRTIEGAGGLSVFQQRWRPAEVRGVLFIIHGLADHGGRYDAFARQLPARRTAVYAIYHLALGRS